MVVKAQGEFVWHSHANTDDFFLVLKGRLTIGLRDREIGLKPGELFVVPRGVEHQPSVPSSGGATRSLDCRARSCCSARPAHPILQGG